eukprot:Em0006g354a
MKQIGFFFFIYHCTSMTNVQLSKGSTQSLPCHTASGDNCTSSICPNTVVTYICTITSGTPAGYTDWTLPTGTCPSNTFPDKIKLLQFVSGSCSAQGQTGISTCGPYRASSIQSSDPIYCLFSILSVNITATINGHPGAPNAVANTIGPDKVLVVVNPSSSGGLPTSYSVTISNSSYVYSNATPAFLNGSAMVTFTGLTIGTNYTILAVAINCAGSSDPTTIYVSWPASTPSPPPTSGAITSPTSTATPTLPTAGSTQSLPCRTASGDNCTSSICPNTVVTYTCTISGAPAGYTDWTLPTGTCPSNTFPDKIRLSQFVSGLCSAQGQTGISMCGPYRASSIQSSDPIYCLSTILTVNITAAMNGSTVTCSNTILFNTSITAVVSLTTINVVGLPGAPNAVANTIGPGIVLVLVNPSSNGGLPTSYSVTISNSSYVYSNSTPAFLNGSAMVSYTGLTIGTNYTISAVAINCAGSSNPTTIYISWAAPPPSPPTSIASNHSQTSAATPNLTTQELVPPPCDPIATPQAFNLHAEETLYDASTQDQRVPEESLYDGNVPTGRGGNVQEAMYSQPDTSKKNADKMTYAAVQVAPAAKNPASRRAGRGMPPPNTSQQQDVFYSTVKP